MNCDGIRSRMIDYLYDELPDDQRIELEDHVRQCEGCRRQLGIFRHVCDLLDEDASRETRPSLEEVSMVHVMNRVTRRLEKSRRRLRWSMAISLSVLVLMGTLYSLNLRIEIHQSHLVVQWSDHEKADRQKAEVGSMRTEMKGRFVEHQSRLDDLDQLIHAMIRTAAAEDAQRRRETTLLANQIQAIRLQNDTRWRTIGYVIEQLRPPVDAFTSISTSSSSGDVR